MNNVAKACVGAAALAFVLAVVTVFTGPSVAGLTPESFSRAATNLALLALCLFVGFKDEGTSASS